MHNLLWAHVNKFFQNALFQERVESIVAKVKASEELEQSEEKLQEILQEVDDMVSLFMNR